MSKRRSTGIPLLALANPFQLQLAAMGLGLKLFETGAHSAAVIARRSAMLAQASLKPGGLANPEFTRMVLEKVDAVGEAALRAGTHAAKPVAKDATTVAASSLALAEACLNPFHRRVRANAKRLGRKSTRR